MYHIADFFSQIRGRNGKSKAFIGITDIGSGNRIYCLGILQGIRIAGLADVKLVIILRLSHHSYRSRAAADCDTAPPLKAEAGIVGNRIGGSVQFISTARRCICLPFQVRHIDEQVSGILEPSAGVSGRHRNIHSLLFRRDAEGKGGPAGLVIVGAGAGRRLIGIGLKALIQFGPFVSFYL